MVDGTVFSIIRKVIFVDERECRAAHGIFHAQLFAEGMDEGGLTGAHLATKGQYTVLMRILPEPICGISDIGQRV